MNSSLVNPTEWDPMNLKLFDDIRIDLNEGKIELENVFILLNGKTFLNDPFLINGVCIPVTVTAFKPVCLWNYIRDYRLNLIKYKYASNRGPAHASRILELAANELFQAWSPKYCPWNWEKNRPNYWCSEFYCYVLRKASHGIWDWNENLEDFASNWVTDNFKALDLYYEPRNTVYEDLGDLILPGDYAKIKRSGHSTMFVTWVKSPVDRTPVDFDPSLEGNYFLAIGGNQRTEIVNISVYSLYNDPSRIGRDEIVWVDSDANHGDYDNFTDDEDYDGFGNTHALLELTALELALINFPFGASPIPDNRIYLDVIREGLANQSVVDLDTIKIDPIRQNFRYDNFRKFAKIFKKLRANDMK